MQDFRENPNENFRQAYASTALENDLFDSNEMEVELASPWQRMGARIMDGLPFAGIGILAAILVGFMGGSGGKAACGSYRLADLQLSYHGARWPKYRQKNRRYPRDY